MSQLRRKVAVGAVIAILSALGLGLGVNLFLPPQSASSTITDTSSTVGSTTISSVTSTATSTAYSSSTSSATSSSYTSVTSSTTTTATSTTTSTSSSSSSTSASPTFAPNPSVQADPSLAVKLVQSVLLSSNATQIAEQLASALGVAPVTPTGAMHQNDTSVVVYNYSTKVSQFAITFVQNTFVRLDYENLVPPGKNGMSFTPLNASESTLKILASMGIPTATDRLTIQTEDFSPQRYMLEWGPAYAGVPIDGTLAKNADGSSLIQGNDVHFEFDPQSGTPTRIILISPYWYTVSDGFPLNISALQAAHIAANYAEGFGMVIISNPHVSFVVVHNSLYYVVTVGNDAQAFYLVVNPRTGEVGLPS